MKSSFSLFLEYFYFIGSSDAYAKEDIKGSVNIHVPGRNRLEHTGISIQLIGVVIDFSNGVVTHEFLQEERSLEPAGVIMGKKVRKMERSHC